MDNINHISKRGKERNSILNENEIKKLLNKIEKITMKKVHIISAVTKFGLDDLLSSIWNELGY